MTLFRLSVCLRVLSLTSLEEVGLNGMEQSQEGNGMESVVTVPLDPECCSCVLFLGNSVTSLSM